MEPPVSVPMARGAWKEASAALDPPPEPPGILVRSQGLPVGPYALFSVDDPMANSSMLVLPRMTTSAAFSRLVTVASYGGMQPGRILEPTVVGTPSVVKMSLSAIGTPASGPSFSPLARFSSTARACARAPSRSTCRKACTFSSTASIRARWASVTSTAVSSPDAILAAIPAAVSLMMSVMFFVLPQDLRHLETLLLLGRGARERLLGGERRTDLVRAHDVRQRQRVRGRRYVLVGDLRDAGDRADDVVQLSREVLELFGLQLQTRQPCEVGDLLARDARHAAFLWGECVWFGANPMGRGPVPVKRFARSPTAVPGGAAQEVVVVQLLHLQKA